MEGSKLKEFKGSVQLKANVQDVLKVLTNYKVQDQFIYKAKKGSVELIKTEGKNNIYTYMIIETPGLLPIEISLHYIISNLWLKMVL